MTLPTPEEHPDPPADQDLVDVAESETPPSQRQQWRSMLPAAVIGTAVLLVLTFVVMPLVEKIEAIPIAVRVAVTPVLQILIASYAIWTVWRSGQHVFERRLRLIDLLLEGVIAFGVWIGVIIVNLAIGILWKLISSRSPEMPDVFEELISSHNVAILMFLGVMACLSAPVAEELFFRRMLLRSLQGRFPVWVALLLQAALFTALHSYYQGIQFAPLFVLGLALGGLYVWRGTILSSMFLHAIQNTFTMTMLGLIMWASARAPVLGIEMEDADNGVKVVRVIPDSAADEAGLRQGDVITHIMLGGWMSAASTYQDVPDAQTLRMLLMLQSPGDKVHLTVVRNGESLDVPVTLQQRDGLELNEDDLKKDAGE